MEEPYETGRRGRQKRDVDIKKDKEKKTSKRQETHAYQYRVLVHCIGFQYVSASSIIPRLSNKRAFHVLELPVHVQS